METVLDKDKELSSEKTIKILRKRIKSTQSQMSRKEKQLKAAKNEIKRLKKASKEQAKTSVSLGTKPYGHSYWSRLIEASIRLQVLEGLSYEQTAKVMREQVKMFLGIEIRLGASSVREWVLKQSCYQLEQVGKEDWEGVLIIDETVGMGEEKGLAILSLKTKEWEEAPVSLGMEDMEVLRLKSQTSWKGVEIGSLLMELKAETSKPIKYVISDRSSSLIKGCELAGLAHVADCSHWMSSCMEHYYSKLPDFIELQKKMGQLRQKLVHGKNAGLMLPAFRIKGRYMNLFSVVDWLNKIQGAWGKLDDKQRALVGFVKEQEPIVKELIAIIGLVKVLSKWLKIEGITPDSPKKLSQLFAANNLLKTPIIIRFEQDMSEYIQKIRATLPNEKRVFCCSDLIESTFGKYKNRSAKGNFRGITEDFFTVALFNGKFSQIDVLLAMESTSFRKVIEWGEQHLVTSFSKTKRLLWENLAT